MSVIVAAGFWMFWPTITALVQELTPDSHFVHSNSFLLAGVQGGWLVAGAVVGFVYNKIGLARRAVYRLCQLRALIHLLSVRAQRQAHGSAWPQKPSVHESAVARFVHELKEGIAYIKLRPRLLLLGIAWALFIGGMLTQGVITAPFSDRILKSGAVGYGWLNAGWAIGAFMSAILHSGPHTRHRDIAAPWEFPWRCWGFRLISLPFLGSRIHGALSVSDFAHSEQWRWLYARRFIALWAVAARWEALPLPAP